MDSNSRCYLTVALVTMMPTMVMKDEGGNDTDADSDALSMAIVSFVERDDAAAVDDDDDENDEEDEEEDDEDMMAGVMMMLLLLLLMVMRRR